MEKKLIILFDLDGTLIDSTDAILETFHHSFKVHNYPTPKDEDITALIGYPLDVMYRELGVDEDVVWDYVHTYKEYYRVISTQKTTLIVNAKEAVTQANEFATLGIVKTNAEPLMKALEVLDATNREIWMIGDTKLDLMSAKNAGVNSIGVLSGYDNCDILKQHTDMIFSDALEAVKFLHNRKKTHISFT
jgi:phosphoglycolate phosphatase